MPDTPTAASLARRRQVLITGAAGGIGAACVRLFAERGWQVIGWDVQSAGDDFPADGHFVQADLGSAAALLDAFSRLRDTITHLDALVNNAALQVARPALSTSVDEWDAVQAVNLRAPFLLAQQAHPFLKAAGGAIVNVSSVHAIQTSANIAAYAASKGGLLALTRALAIEFAVDGIRVNAVLPGAVDTPMLRAGLGRGHLQAADVEGQLAQLAAKTVNGRVAQPEEIASAIYFLADNAQSSFMTGQALVVDGGATARLSTE